MVFLQPSALLLLLLLPIVVLLHLIRSRYQQRRVPSVLLWRSIPRDLQAYATWRRPLWDLTLLLQLLAVAAAALALARPSLPTADARHLALVIDASASMRATDVSPSRFEVARQTAREMIDRLGQNDLASLIVAGPRPHLLVSDRRKPALQGALSQARPTNEPSDMASALALASSLAVAQPGQRAEVVAITDGAFDLDIAALPTPARLINVGSSVENRAISEVSLRSNPIGGTTLAGFARIVNTGAEEAEVRVLVLADGLAVHSRATRVPAAGSTEVAFAVPDGTRRLALSLGSADVQPADDRVEMPAPASLPRRVLVVSDSPSLWERVLRALPGVTVHSISSDAYSPPPSDALVVLDGYVPSRLPQNDLLIVNPPPTGQVLSVVGEVRQARVRDFDREDPLLRGVDLSPMAASRGLVIQLPPWASSAADGDAGSLIFHGTLDRRRIVVFAFDPYASNLPQLSAFPVLMANSVNWLTPGRTDETQGGLRQETTAAPRAHPPIPAVRELPGGGLPERELWPVLVGLGLLLLSAEWWFYTRRG